MSGLRTRRGGAPWRAGDQRSGRRRPPPRPVEVVSVSKLTPRLVSVHLRGGGLEEFQDAAPTSHLKVWVACEAIAARRIRRHLLENLRLRAESIVSRGPRTARRSRRLRLRRTPLRD